MKVVINSHFGGFGLSHKAMMRYAEIKGIKLYAYTYDRHNSEKLIKEWTEVDKAPHPFRCSYSTKKVKTCIELNAHFFHDSYIERNDPALVQTVEELGKEANGSHAKLKIINIPDEIKFIITEYDGYEQVAEEHETWD